MGKRARAEAARQGGVNRPQAGGTPLRGGEDAAAALARVVVFGLYYGLPALLAAAACWVAATEAFDGGASFTTASAVAFFLPLGWGSVVLTQYRDPVRRLLKLPGSDLVEAAVGTAGSAALIAFAFGASGTTLWRLFALGSLLGVAVTLKASEDRDGSVRRLFARAQKPTVLVLTGLLTGLALVAINSSGTATP